MLRLFPSANRVSISNALSVFPDMSNQRGDSFKKGALPAQYISVEMTMKEEKSLHSLMMAANPDMEQIPHEKGPQTEFVLSKKKKKHAYLKSTG